MRKIIQALKTIPSSFRSETLAMKLLWISLALRFVPELFDAALFGAMSFGVLLVRALVFSMVIYLVGHTHRTWLKILASILWCFYIVMIFPVLNTQYIGILLAALIANPISSAIWYLHVGTAIVGFILLFMKKAVPKNVDESDIRAA